MGISIADDEVEGTWGTVTARRVTVGGSLTRIEWHAVREPNKFRFELVAFNVSSARIEN